MLEECLTPVGLEPTIPGSVGRCLIHWATGPLVRCFRIFYIEVTHLGGQQRMKMQVTPMMGRGGEYLSKMVRSMPLALQGTALSLHGDMGSCTWALKRKGQKTTALEECLTPVGLESRCKPQR